MIEVTNISPPATMSITGNVSAPERAKKRPSVALCPNADPPAVNTIIAIPSPAVRPSPALIFSTRPARIMRRSGRYRTATEGGSLSRGSRVGT